MKAYFERQTVIAAGEHHLDALYRKGNLPRAVLLVPGVSQRGQGRDSAVLSELTFHLAQAGFSTLRFSWRGTGASTGAPALDPLAPPASIRDVLPPFLEDLAAALDELRATEPDSDVTLLAHSVGCVPGWTFAADNPALSRTIWVAPPSSDGAMGERTGDVPRPMVFVGGEDPYARPADVEAWLPPGVPVSVVPGAGHDFARGLSALCLQVVQRLRIGTPDPAGLS